MAKGGHVPRRVHRPLPGRPLADGTGLRRHGRVRRGRPHRGHEGRADGMSSGIRIISKMKVSPEDVPEVERIFRKFIDDAREKDPGVTDLAYYVDEEQGV